MSVDNLWNNDYYAGYDGCGSGMKCNGKKMRNIIQSPEALTFWIAKNKV